MKTLLFSLLMLAVSFSSFSQDDSNISFVMLGNDKIADVNLDSDKYLKDIDAVISAFKSETKDMHKNQRLAVLLTLHKDAKATFEVYSNPKLSNEKEASLLVRMSTIDMGNSKYVDFPVLIGLNTGESANGLNVTLPIQKMKEEYEAASLSAKLELNKKWAVENLPVLIAYEKDVDDKFLGVKNFGRNMAAVNFNAKQNIDDLTSANPDYWRAVMEMETGNQLIPLTKVFMLVSQGKLDEANIYIDMIRFFSNPKAIANDYLEELAWRIKTFNDELVQEVNKGIAKHDSGNYDEAIMIYNNILQQYPGSAWTLYELYYSKNMKDLAGGKKDDRADWDKAKKLIYECNPMYHMDVRASNGKEAYLLFRRQEQGTLFRRKEQTLEDTFKYADIAMDLGVYDFAAQLFWLSATYVKEGNERILYRYLYCLDKLGVKDLKANFKGDFEKIFKEIDKEKEKEMKKSDFYKSF